jgi:hypothetical protein
MFSNLHIYKTNSILQAVATGVDSEYYSSSGNLFSLFVGLVCGSSILILNGLLVVGDL